MDVWDQHFAARSPMFDPLRGVCNALSAAAWPSPAQLTVLAQGRKLVSGGGQPLRFETLTQATAAADYESCIHDEGVAPLREANWHDFFNAAAWLAFPRTKAALNRAHVAALQVQQGAARSRARDALTLFDESGVLVLSSSRAVLDGIRAFDWGRVFCEARDELPASTQFVVFGHALYEKALAPYVGMTGHALLIETAGLTEACDVDAVAAQALLAGITQPRDLSPLPLLGVPGWWDANRDAAFYGNTAYFRPGRMRASRRGDQAARTDGTG
jgi:Protein of unknown function (DUF3025)